MISIIAALCSINIGAMSITIEKIDAAQLSCQKYYIECLSKSPIQPAQESQLRECILNRELK